MQTLTLKGHRKQQGIALVIAILFLLVMSIVATSAVQNTVLDEKMAGNFQQKERLFEAAEATLKIAEEYVQDNTIDDSNFTADCTNGLCQPNYSSPVWLSTNSATWAKAVRPTLSGVSFTASPAAVCPTPCYLIEHVVAPPDSTGSLVVGNVYSVPPSSYEYYRITARASQRTSDNQYNTEVLLQSIYKK